MIPGAVTVWKALPTKQRRLIVALLFAIALANVAQPYPDLTPLQHGPTIALLLAAPWVLHRWRLSDRSVIGITLFLALHTLGARYIYSYVPYDDWARALTGHDLSSLFGWTRNGYDRLVHFGFGALLTLPIAEILRKHGGMSLRMTLIVAFAFIGLGSALYEVFEWLLTIVAAGDTADYYNGQQGDIWDAQKDMLAAQIGSSLAVLIALVAERRAAYS